MGGFPIDIASIEPREPTHEELYPEPPPRRCRGGLEGDVLAVFEQLSDDLSPIEAPATPFRVSRLIQKRDGLAVRPSTGGVTDAFKRLVAMGAIEVTLDPYAFRCFTSAYHEVGVEELRIRQKQSKKKS